MAEPPAAASIILIYEVRALSRLMATGIHFTRVKRPTEPFRRFELAIFVRAESPRLEHAALLCESFILGVTVGERINGPCNIDLIIKLWSVKGHFS